MCICISYLILLYVHVLNLGGDYPLQVPEGVAWFVWVDVSTWFVDVRSSSAESTFGGSFEHGSHVPVVCWKDFFRNCLTNKSHLRQGPISERCEHLFLGSIQVFCGATSKIIQVWRVGWMAQRLELQILGWRNRWKKSFLLFLHSLKPTVRPESRPGPRRKRSSYFQTLLFRSF